MQQKKQDFYPFLFTPLFILRIRRTALFDFLNNVELFTNTPIKPCDELGHELPGIMCDWLKGSPSDEILKQIKKSAHINRPLWQLAQAIFNPETMAQSQTLIPEGQEMVERCIKNGHKVYILSNWDGESFGQIQERYPEFFDKFSGIILSGECGLLKPDPAIYKHLLDECGGLGSCSLFLYRQPTRECHWGSNCRNQKCITN